MLETAFVNMTMQIEQALSPKEQEVIRQDFGDFNGRYVVEQASLEPSDLPYFQGIEYRSFTRLLLAVRRSSPGFVWFENGVTIHDWKKLYASSQDYVAVRNDPDALKEFLEQRLDAGKIDTSFGGMSAEDREISPAVYVHFLHLGSSYRPFTESLERAVIELTEKELSMNLNNPDLQEVRRRVGRSFDFHYAGSIINFFSNINRSAYTHPDSIGYSALHLGVGQFTEEQEEQVRQELLVTCRMPSDEEYKQLEGQSRERRPVMHFEELPSATMALIKENLLKYNTNIYLFGRSTESTHRYNRLTSLLEIGMSIGTPKGPLTELYPLLKEAAESGRYRQIPTIKIGAFDVNVENHLLMALAALQPGTELREFWLNRIATDPSDFRVLTAIEGIAKMSEDRDAREAEKPRILAALSKRGIASDHEENDPVNEFISKHGLQFYVDYKLQDLTN